MRKALCLIFALLLFGTSARADCIVTSIMYHNVTTDASRYNDWCISASQLESDITAFKANGYIPITATELANEDMANLDGKKILLLTFDDGYAEWYTDVFPILERTETKATMFVVGSYVNRYGYLGEDEIHEMANSGLVEIGSHTRYLHSMPLATLKNIYASQNISDAVDDIQSNNEYLADITGKPVTSLAWPYGCYTDTIDRRVKNELGCRITFSTSFGVTRYDGDTSIVFNRINRDYSKTTDEITQIAERKRAEAINK